MKAYMKHGKAKKEYKKTLMRIKDTATTSTVNARRDIIVSMILRYRHNKVDVRFVDDFIKGMMADYYNTLKDCKINGDMKQLEYYFKIQDKVYEYYLKAVSQRPTMQPYEHMTVACELYLQHKKLSYEKKAKIDEEIHRRLSKSECTFWERNKPVDTIMEFSHMANALAGRN